MSMRVLKSSKHPQGQLLEDVLGQVERDIELEVMSIPAGEDPSRRADALMLCGLLLTARAIAMKRVPVENVVSLDAFGRALAGGRD